MFRYAFISDIHGNILALEAVIENILNEGIPLKNIYCLGDLVGYGPNPNEVIKFIRDRRIKTIMGNYDEAVGFYLPSCGCKLNSKRDKDWMHNSLNISSKLTSEENKEFLRELEESMLIEINGYSILLVHGSPFSIVEYVYEDNIEAQEAILDELDVDAVFFGHTHFPYIKKINDMTLINTGSVGRPKDRDNRAGYVIGNFENELSFEIRRVEYDVFEMDRRLKESEFLDVFGDILLCGCTDFDLEEGTVMACQCDLKL